MVTGIIAEYDPFHKGHAFLARKAREDSDCVVAVMSGNVTQRGEFACFGKRERVRAALENGIDLCVELPAPWACASAADFARGGVALLRMCGAGRLLFGSECGNAEALKRAACEIASADGSAIRGAVKSGGTYASAVGASVSAETSSLLAAPNNLLGIEYINAAAELAPEMEIATVKRVGAGHSDGESDGFASASYIRALARESADYTRLLPDGCAEILAAAPLSDTDAADRALLHLLRGISAAELAEIDGVTEGLENRIVRAAAEAARFADVAALVKSKRYTLARIRRLLLRCLIGIRRDSLPPLPPYVRVLGLNERGAARLNAIKKSVPLLTKPADRDRLDADGQTVFTYELKAAELYALTLPPAPAGTELRYTPVVIK